MRTYYSHTGFTLVETLVAVSILIVGIVGPVALIGRALVSTSFSRNDLIAHNLAQEGIELFREVRDNNVLCGSLDGGATPWNRDPDSGGGPPTLRDHYEIDAFDSMPMSSPLCANIMTPRPINRNSPNCVTVSRPLLIDADGIYNYTSGAPTNFRRCMQVCSPPQVPPCRANADTGDVPLIPDDDQMEIISTVSWIERGTPKSVTLRDRLYNWE